MKKERKVYQYQWLLEAVRKKKMAENENINDMKIYRREEMTSSSENGLTKKTQYSVIIEENQWK